MKDYKFIKFNENTPIEIQQERMDSLKDVIIPLDISLAKIQLTISDIQKFVPGYMFSINKDASDIKVDILTNNNKSIATGEIVIIDHKAYVKIIDIKK